MTADASPRGRVCAPLMLALLCAGIATPAWSQTLIPTPAPDLTTVETADSEEIAGESAIRRFEIVTLTALPFTAIHSFLIVKGVRVASEGNIAADVDGSDWNYVGLGAATLAIGIGVYDYLRMRGKDRNEQLLPSPPPPVNLLEPPARAPQWSVPLASLSVTF